MRDVESERDGETAYECFDCGAIERGESNPGACSDCGGPMRNRTTALE